MASFSNAIPGPQISKSSGDVAFLYEPRIILAASKELTEYGELKVGELCHSLGDLIT